MINNVHTRRIPGNPSSNAPLIDRLAANDDPLWPSDRWPSMRLDQPLAAGAVGGHGMVRYRVESYAPGSSVVFRFDPAIGLVGTHTLTASADGSDGTTITHTIDAQANGSMKLMWPFVVRWLHDALLEDALDNAEAFARHNTVVRQPLPIHVRFLRVLVNRIR